MPDAEGVLDLTRAQFEKLCQPLFNRTFDTVAKVIKDAKLEPKDVDDVVLVGGSTRVPRIQAPFEFFSRSHIHSDPFCKEQQTCTSKQLLVICKRVSPLV